MATHAVLCGALRRCSGWVPAEFQPDSTSKLVPMEMMCFWSRYEPISIQLLLLQLCLYWFHAVDLL